MSTKVDTVLAAVGVKLANLATSGPNVFVGYAYDIPAGSLPAIRIRQGAQTPQGGRPANVFGYIDIELTLSVDIWILPGQSINEVKAEIYTALVADRTLGLTFVETLWWTDDTEPNYSAVGEIQTVFMVTGWTIVYRQPANTAR